MEVAYTHVTLITACLILASAFHQSNFRQLLIEAVQNTGKPTFLQKTTKKANPPTHAQRCSQPSLNSYISLIQQHHNPHQAVLCPVTPDHSTAWFPLSSEFQDIW